MNRTKNEQENIYQDDLARMQLILRVCLFAVQLTFCIVGSQLTSLIEKKPIAFYPQ